MKKCQFSLPENFRFLEVKFSIYLNRRVFVMLIGKRNTKLVTTQLLLSWRYYAGVMLIYSSTFIRKHAYIILIPLNSILYSKTGVYWGIHNFSHFCLKT